MSHQDTPQLSPHVGVFSWPDEYTGIVCQIKEPAFMMRVEPLPNNRARTRILRASPEFFKLGTVEKVLAQVIPLFEYAIESGMVERAKEFEVVNGLDHPLPPLMVVHDITVAQDEIPCIAVISTETLQQVHSPAALGLAQDFNQRLEEIVALEDEGDEEDEETEENGTSFQGAYETSAKVATKPLIQAQKATTTQRPVLLIDYESESDYRVFRGKTQPGSLSEWRSQLSEVQRQLRQLKPSLNQPRRVVLDGSRYLRWLAQRNLALTLETQQQFLLESLRETTAAA